MLIHGQIGPQTLSVGQRGGMRQFNDGAVCNVDAHAHYMDAVLGGNVYIGANPQATGVTTQAGLSATSPALTLYNPTTSPVDLVLLTVTVAVNAAPAAATLLSLAMNLQQATAPATVGAANIMNALGITRVGFGLCYRYCTLATAPIAYRYLGGIIAASSTNQQSIIDNIDGQIVLAPGVALSVQATTAVGVVCSFCWEEVANGYV